MNRAWAYIIGKPLSEEELEQLSIAGNNFVSSWTAHENKLQGEFRIFNKRIVVVQVNEDLHTASGCSIDKLVRFIKTAESTFHTELLNRLLIAYKSGDAVEVAHSSKIKDLLSQGLISETTPVYNTAISNDEELRNWEQPLKDTWLSKYLVKA